VSVFVLDASVTMAWCFEDEATPDTDAVLDRLGTDEAAVPAIWPLEVANVLLIAERRGRVSEAQSSRFAGLLAQLPIHVDDHPGDIAALAALGRRHELSSYDASYLALAQRLGAGLATLDRPLAGAAVRAGVHLLIAPQS
jgi:predicted nucleic acid-binding protein